ncbi:hypothetical protein ZOSMA_162G00270 [Zostera marina]|uniref:Guanylyl cyclase n=1 Tax=Zostera marina TaxID=29655 RepID=A0A0K9PU54_ZOSMR|nr:hypothetical protein ZOSMA_162G00270 [Zostera marina]
MSICASRQEDEEEETFVWSLEILSKAGDQDTSLITCSSHPNPSANSLRSFSVDVPHVQQVSDWDCGIACVLMVLRTLGLTHCEIHHLRDLCPTNSIWTIDLAYLLHTFSVAFSYHTTTIGANPDYCVEAYYREQLRNDIVRVDGLFQKAEQVGIDVQNRSTSAQEISGLILSGNYIAVALVDKFKLSDSLTKDVHDSRSYIGHYVVLCGFNMNTEEFDMRDPSSKRKHEKASLKCFEDAHSTFGTDHDILLEMLKTAIN